jgi:arylsulfatase A-like enzyme
MDPHGRYEPPAEFRTFHGPSEPTSVETPPGEGARRKRFVAQFNVPDEARLPDGRFDAGRVKDLYDGEVSYVDAMLKELFAQLGSLENTLVVFTSDHGEAFGEHEVWFEHGQDAYEETAHIPLVVRFPKDERARPKGIRSDVEISLCDIAPTILEYVGVAPLHPLSESGETERGRSRLDRWFGGPGQASATFVERVDRTAGTQYKAARLGDWKLVRRYAQTVRTGSKDKEMKPALRGEELFDLAHDPNEQRDLSATPPPDAPVARLREELDRFTALDARFGALGPKPKTARTAEEEAEHQRKLDNLGYGGGNSDGDEPAPPKSTDPKSAPKPDSKPAPPEKKPD